MEDPTRFIFQLDVVPEHVTVCGMDIESRRAGEEHPDRDGEHAQAGAFIVLRGTENR
jgi:hypothetical protein